MPTLQIEHRVRDFDAWKQAFDRDPVGREQGGVRRHRVRQAGDDPNLVVVDLEFDDLEQAETFRTALGELWERAGSSLGLEVLRVWILEEVESREY